MEEIINCLLAFSLAMCALSRRYACIHFATSSCLLEGKVDYNDDVGQLTCLIDTPRIRVCEICCYLVQSSEVWVVCETENSLP
jgi:hypothetical protein